MATQPQSGLTDQDLQSFPEDNFRRELIDGELIVTAAPATRHQDVVLRLGAALLAHCKQHGGRVFVAPTDVYFSDTNVVEPDVLYIRPENAGRIEKQLVRSAPDLVVEVSSPTARRSSWRWRSWSTASGSSRKAAPARPVRSWRRPGTSSTNSRPGPGRS